MALWIDEAVRGSFARERLAAALQRLEAAWPEPLPRLEHLVSDLPFPQAALFHLLAISPASVKRLVKNPDALVWLSKTGALAEERNLRKLREAWGRFVEQAPGAGDSQTSSNVPFDPAFRSLRRFKQWQMLRLGLREVAGFAGMEETTRELSALAELCVGEVLAGWLRELTRRWGCPPCGFAVLGMGKLGGQELNYSSDIDLVLVYGQDGWLNPNFSHQEFYSRLAEKLVGTFSATEPEGTLFRVDLRLRPEGAAGPLVCSLAKAESYYAGYGETWERMAWIRARHVAGDEALSYELLQRLQPFIFPKTLSLDVLEEVGALKTRIERDVVKPSELHRNVKLGVGGIREVEFVVQMFQLIHGARHAFLQERNTLRVLNGLQALGLLSTKTAGTLAKAYRFLRTVEHRLQIEEDAQTHTVPKEGEALNRLAASLGFDSAGEFQARLKQETGAVRAIFEDTLRTQRHPEVGGEVKRDFFSDPARASKALESLARGPQQGHVSPRTRRLLGQLEPLLIKALSHMADPDTTLARVVRFVERYGSAGTLFETLVVHPRFLELLVKLFDASHWMTETLLRRPGLLEEMTRSGLLGRRLEVEDYVQGLASPEEGLDWLDWVRVYRQAQGFRIGLRDLLAFAPPQEVMSELSALTEACLVFVHKQQGLQGRFMLVSMGKFGGCELGYGGDVDLVFVGEQQPGVLGAAASYIHTITAVSAHGQICNLDTRLRPEGDAGLLVMPLAAYEDYFAHRARFWEAQALTKARPLAGGIEAQAFIGFAKYARLRFAQNYDVAHEVAAMLERIQKERGSGDDFADFKTGRGGVMEAEFHVQVLQMRHGVWEVNTFAALDALVRTGHLAAERAKLLGDALLFLRRVEMVIRRMENRNVALLPTHETERRHLAIRLGFTRYADFEVRYEAARRVIHLQAW